MRDDWRCSNMWGNSDRRRNIRQVNNRRWSGNNRWCNYWCNYWRWSSDCCDSGSLVFLRADTATVGDGKVDGGANGLVTLVVELKPFVSCSLGKQPAR